jgi:predicted Zn-dependent peptidase
MHRSIQKQKTALLPVEVVTLANGVRLVMTPLPQVESVSLGIWAGVGGRHESPAQSGISHFIEHLLFKGTRHFSCRAISQAIEGRGGYLNAFTQEETTCYYARVAAGQAGRAFDVLADMVRRPNLALADIVRERAVIVEEIQMYRDQPAQWVEDLLGALMWVGHPLGRPIVGTPETLRGLNRRSIAQFHQTAYSARNIVLSISGAIDRDAIIRRAVAEFEPHRTAPPPRFAPVTARVAQHPIDVRPRDIEQVHLALGIRVEFGRADRRRFLFKLLNVILGENMSSRLFVTLREREGLAYEIHSSCQLMDETGSLDISAGLDPRRTVRAIRLIVRELHRLRTDRVGAREFRRAQEYTVGQIRLGLESTSTRMLWAGETLLNSGRVVPPEEVIDGIERSTAEDLRELAAELFTSRRLSLALVVPEKLPTDHPSYLDEINLV